MEHEYDGINVGRLATLAVVATFPGLRKFIGILCLLGLIGAGALTLVAMNPGDVPVNPNPVCNRVTYLVLEQMSDGPRDWGRKIYADKAIYYREANGTGYCMLKHDSNPVVVPDPVYKGGIWKYRVYEVPSKYGAQVAQIVPKNSSEPYIVPILLGGFSLAVLLGIWLPATIVAAVGRRLMKNAREEFVEGKE